MRNLSFSLSIQEKTLIICWEMLELSQVVKAHCSWTHDIEERTSIRNGEEKNSIWRRTVVMMIHVAVILFKRAKEYSKITTRLFKEKIAFSMFDFWTVLILLYVLSSLPYSYPQVYIESGKFPHKLTHWFHLEGFVSKISVLTEEQLDQIKMSCPLD